jgi:hypothetical protein
MPGSDHYRKPRELLGDGRRVPSEQAAAAQVHPKIGLAAARALSSDLPERNLAWAGPDSVYRRIEDVGDQWLVREAGRDWKAAA